MSRSSDLNDLRKRSIATDRSAEQVSK